ncbi:hypothetical protein [Flammeovirga aprica]|uniref:Uncharacterized protein n=1 Tax=Flammeovirga aprica JL-4 TaxID=694437 RepID=A0A7X9S0Q7_9BACT|nr:hypothetical protein [Flammeovirga aprica]NME72022.1 hypothetical protein [Flammeovirga aprica JL-4]
MKLKVILNNLLPLFFWIFVLIIKELNPGFPINRGFCHGAIIGAIIYTVLYPRKYLTNVILERQHLTLEWTTTFFKQKSQVFEIAEVRFQFKKRNYIFKASDQILLDGDFGQLKFYLINQKLKEKVKEILPQFKKNL